MNTTADVAKPTLRIVRVKIGSRWLKDGMRKWEGYLLTGPKDRFPIKKLGHDGGLVAGMTKKKDRDHRNTFT